MRPHPFPRRVVILGLGLFGGGAGAARYFAERGAHVVVTDRRNADQLTESLQDLASFPIEYHLGEHRQKHFDGADLVVVNPAVAPDAPAMAMARGSGAPLDTGINILFKHSRAPIAAVTGTHGKSTTVALLGAMMRAAGRKTWVGGNIGGSLLPDLDAIAPDDIVVLEVSSFQSERLAWARAGPHLAVVLNLVPNHLDRHRNMDEYVEAKRRLLRYQNPGDYAILSAEDPILRTWQDVGRAEKFFFDADPSEASGAYMDDQAVHLRRPSAEESISLSALRLLGRHNRFNAAAAAAAAWLLGADRNAVERAIATVEGLPDRIEFVAEKAGVRFYNDSIATTPEAAMAALDSLDRPIVLIAGGSSKNLSFRELGRRIALRARAVVLVGRTAPELRAAIASARGKMPSLQTVTTFEAAVTAAREMARPGDAVLLSPACASFDMFRNYAERGRTFRRIVNAL